MAETAKKAPATVDAPDRQGKPAAASQGTPLKQLLALADGLRRRSRWKEAAELYRMAEPKLPPNAAIKHNLALCELGMGKPKPALALTEAALSLQPSLWQSTLLRAKALVALDRFEEAVTALRGLLDLAPAQGDARVELASIYLHKYGDAESAANMVAPLHEDERHAADAELTRLMAGLYDRDHGAEAISDEIKAFARRYLEAPGTDAMLASRPVQMPVGAGSRIRKAPSRRQRVGLISPQFCCSPVYFFCYGSLRLLASEADLVFVHRGFTEDWATKKLRAIAHEWIDAAPLDGESLAVLLKKQNFDVLIDLGGWMDSIALRALATKPAARMYKWVGGQSATTGLRVFDGMLSDRHQSPRSTQALYSEPLILLKSGYVTYAAPDYLPAPVPGTGNALGVIANPAKVSRDFLAGLARRLVRLHRGVPLSLRFIDRKYGNLRTCARIRAALEPLEGIARLEFIVPASHRAYLHQVGRLDAVIDTWPYTGGLTTVEALAMGVPCLTRAGNLFSERHTYAHCRYADIPVRESNFDRVDIPALLASPASKRKSLLLPGSRRLDHAALARELARIIQSA